MKHICKAHVCEPDCGASKGYFYQNANTTTGINVSQDLGTLKFIFDYIHGPFSHTGVFERLVDVGEIYTKSRSPRFTVPLNQKRQGRLSNVASLFERKPKFRLREQRFNSLWYIRHSY